MNYATHIIGSNASVASRFGTENGIIRPEKLLDILCFNESAGVLYMQLFEVPNNLVPYGAVYSGGNYSLTGLTAGHTYYYQTGLNEHAIVNSPQNIVIFGTNSVPVGTFVANGTSITISAGGAFGSSPVTLTVLDVTTIQSEPVPVAGSTPLLSFPVLNGLGGTLGREIDISGIFCAWSTTGDVFTAAGASGPIQIIVKG